MNLRIDKATEVSLLFAALAALGIGLLLVRMTLPLALGVGLGLVVLVIAIVSDELAMTRSAPITPRWPIIGTGTAAGNRHVPRLREGWVF